MNASAVALEAYNGVQDSLPLGRAVAQELEKALGQPFTLWSSAEDCLPLGLSDSRIDTSSLGGRTIGEILRGQELEQHSIAVSLAENRQLLAVPMRSNGCARLLVAGLVTSETASIACALADSILRSHELKLELDAVHSQLAKATSQLDSCLLQVTTSFEELTWLRSLAEHFEICSLENSLADAAQVTLPSLRRLIYAQELFLFGMHVERERDGIGVDLPLLAFDGDRALSETAARHLIVEVAARRPKQSVVWNEPGCDRPSDKSNQVRSYILTPVVKCQEQLGWLLAINKNIPPDNPLLQSVQAGDRNLVEFGTTEAGLLSTMAVMLATHGNNVELINEKEALLVGVIRALVDIIDAKDAYTCGHSDRVASMSKRIAQQLGQSPAECEQAYMAGLLHDIGKIGVPDKVLGKSTGLTDQEYALVRMHPEIGAEILRHLKPFSYVLPGVLHHHETFDGQGYPHGLAGEAIPLLARIIAVADSYDAMTSDRTYRKGMPTTEAESILRNGAGSQWDTEIIDAFLTALPDIHDICGIDFTMRTEEELMIRNLEAEDQHLGAAVSQGR